MASLKWASKLVSGGMWAKSKQDESNFARIWKDKIPQILKAEIEDDCFIGTELYISFSDIGINQRTGILEQPPNAILKGTLRDRDSIKLRLERNTRTISLSVEFLTKLSTKKFPKITNVRYHWRKVSEDNTYQMQLTCRVITSKPKVVHNLANILLKEARLIIRINDFT